MAEPSFYIRQLADEIEPPATGKQRLILNDDEASKVVLFAFAAGDGLPEHLAPLPATIQIIKGTATLTVGDEKVAGKPGTWIQMAPKIRHSINAETPLILLLTLRK